MDTVGIPASVPVAELIENYAKLVRGQVCDPAQWQAVHRFSPKWALTALTAVCHCASPADLSALIYSMSESPAMLFARLGDGRNYDEGSRFVEFVSRQSADAFHVQHPDWFCWCQSD